MRAGVDLGVHLVHIGVVEPPDYISAAFHLEIDKSHSPADIADMLDRLISLFSISNIDRISIEKPLVFHGQGLPVFQMVELLTLVKLAANRLQIPVTIITPPQWRKNVLGHGHSDKAKAIDFCKSLGWETKDHNEAESICIGFYDG